MQHARRQRRQHDRGAIVQRKLGNADAADHHATVGVIGVEQRGRASHADGFRLRADLQADIDVGHLRHLQHDVGAFELAKAGNLHAQGVDAWVQEEKPVLPRFVGGGGEGDPSAKIE